MAEHGRVGTCVGWGCRRAGGESAFACALVRPVLRGYRSSVMDWTQCPAVERVPGKVSGATVKQFLEWFPGVKREQVMAVLKFTESSLAEVVA